MSGVAPSARLTILTSSTSLARLLWSHGEDRLWREALWLSPDKVACIGAFAGELALEQPGLGTDGALIAAAIENLEGTIRPPARARRRNEKETPQHLREIQDDVWAAPGLIGITRFADPVI